MSVSVKCAKCNYILTEKNVIYCKRHFPFMLCMECQYWFKAGYISTPSAKKLYLGLKTNGLPVKLELKDGKKTIDIAVPDYRTNIEVDGIHHNTSFKQARSDLFRNYYSLKKGYYTIHIPNTLIEKDLELTVNVVKNLILENNERIKLETEKERQLKELNELKQHFLDFKDKFEAVFDLDWVYTQDFIKNLHSAVNFMSRDLDGSNWNNRDELMNQYRLLSERLRQENNQNTDR